MTRRDSGIRDFSGEQDEAVVPDQRMTPDEFEEFLAKAREMILIREQKDRVAKREAELKPGLMEALSAYGLPSGESGQHRVIEFPQPIRKVLRFVRQAKVTTGVDEVAGEAIARERGIYDRLFKPVMTLDDSAVMVALEEGLLTDEDIKRIFPKKTIYAFVAEKSR